ncbi:MAG: zinc metallopeptidase [Chitinophagaceae bacterium]|nr:zinc metallopeptidase [Chitinophagaceae bacterium]MBK7678403.1 zinc metallopeptidase [Chitinophagaceae bacterium]MBK8300238.1 zinc metallopeptidase [Chitinophagaceae bacterium]MBK9464282.1 zinc metallopeptidase [Chitinophagaceae bacterium]MBK9658594.1 zinc metallopeptidase [Chitinophagaceae bacterium]
MSNEIFIVSLVFLGISFLVSAILKSKFTKYSKIGLANGLSGREIAEKMLKENGIYDVKVTSVEGFLSDHYNPVNKTVNLSPDVYNGTSVSAAAVAAHECGHAVQHATKYGPLMLRSKLVPAVQMSSMLVNWILLAGMIVLATTKNPTILLVGIIVMSVTVLFTLITLPVEFDASKRALAWLDRTNITNSEEYPKAKDALKWAATTYVVAALAAVVTLIQYIMIYLGSRDRS